MEYKEGICPVCGSKNVIYDLLKIIGDKVYYPVMCEDCYATWEEYYDLIFSRHYNIEKWDK